MTYHGPTREGPPECLHNAPIDAICLECERWALSPDSPTQRPLRLVEALENLALNDQRAHLPLSEGAYVIVTKCECDGLPKVLTPRQRINRATVTQHCGYHYYVASIGGNLVVATRHMLIDAIADWQAA